MGEAANTAAFWRAQHLSGNVPDYEEILREGFEAFLEPGDVVIDVGVNEGRHFRRFLELVAPTGRVIGYEPAPELVARSLTACGQGADIRAIALSDRNGAGTFLYMANAIGESGFKERTTPGDRGVTPIEVPISTLDDELADIDRIDYIKIDTEGHELSILAGAKTLIARHQPIISVEWGAPTYELYGHHRGSLYEMAESIEYRISDLFGNLVEGAEEWQNVSDQSFWDFLSRAPAELEHWATYFRREAS